LLWDGVSCSVFFGLACACMLFSVKFNVAKRDVRYVEDALMAWVAERETARIRGTSRKPVFHHCQAGLDSCT
jgi:hypothetical protein